MDPLIDECVGPLSWPRAPPHAASTDATVGRLQALRAPSSLVPRPFSPLAATTRMSQNARTKNGGGSRGGRSSASQLNSYFGYTGARENAAATTIQWWVTTSLRGRDGSVASHPLPPSLPTHTHTHTHPLPSGGPSPIAGTPPRHPPISSMVRSVNAITHAEALWEDAMDRAEQNAAAISLQCVWRSQMVRSKVRHTCRRGRQIHVQSHNTTTTTAMHLYLRRTASLHVSRVHARRAGHATPRHTTCHHDDRHNCYHHHHHYHRRRRRRRQVLKQLHLHREMGGSLKEGSVRAARDAWGSARAAARSVQRLNKGAAASSGPSWSSFASEKPPSPASPPPPTEGYGHGQPQRQRQPQTRPQPHHPSAFRAEPPEAYDYDDGHVIEESEEQAAQQQRDGHEKDMMHAVGSFDRALTAMSSPRSAATEVRRELHECRVYVWRRCSPARPELYSYHASWHLSAAAPWLLSPSLALWPSLPLSLSPSLPLSLSPSLPPFPHTSPPLDERSSPVFLSRPHPPPPTPHTVQRSENDAWDVVGQGHVNKAGAAVLGSSGRGPSDGLQRSSENDAQAFVGAGHVSRAREKVNKKAWAKAKPMGVAPKVRSCLSLIHQTDESLAVLGG